VLDSKTLTIGEALRLLEDGNWHSIAYVTADRQKQEGGKIVRIKDCALRPKENLNIQNSTSESKRQYHFANATRNVRLRNGLVRKFHIHTLFAVDNIPVL
jgi:hypothetical protein